MTTGEEKEQRAAFEAWITEEPFSKHIDRFTSYDAVWPGQYKELSVELAWKAWIEAVKRVEPVMESTQHQ